MASDGNVEKKSVAASANVYVSDYHRFGWLLFLALRVHAFSRFKDLVTCTNGLVSILVGDFFCFFIPLVTDSRTEDVF